MDWDNIYTIESYNKVMQIMADMSLFASHACNFTPYGYQQQYLDFTHKFQFSLSIKSRQLGLTLTSAAYLYWYAINHENSNIVIMGYNQHSSTAIIQTIQKFISDGPRFFSNLSILKNTNTINFINGSQIVAVSASDNSLRGRTITILYLDEFGYVPLLKQQSIIQGGIPSLHNTNGKMIITTSTGPKSNIVETLWNSNSTFEKLLLPYYCIDRPGGWAYNMENAIGKELFDREYQCRFV